jgi:hypothetical protein
MLAWGGQARRSSFRHRQRTVPQTDGAARQGGCRPPCGRPEKAQAKTEQLHRTLSPPMRGRAKSGPPRDCPACDRIAGEVSFLPAKLRLRVPAASRTALGRSAGPHARARTSRASRLRRLGGARQPSSAGPRADCTFTDQHTWALACWPAKEVGRVGWQGST